MQECEERMIVTRNATCCNVRILVLPAASSPSINIRISLLPNIFDISFPIVNGLV